MVKECQAKRIILASCSPEITHSHIVRMTPFHQSYTNCYSTALILPTQPVSAQHMLL